ncbi:MAG: tRNA threonylcarbamoyladenosine dehydratase [Elusimicrobia bacterium]|jgi:tRNA A37 threonylcarbamoyladenosine dehydratase|nr:tRNA threonylcarbamoyladenosine dehydratase [Elusimicrobiota bacterium]
MTQTNNKEQFVRTKLLLGTTKTEKIFNSKVTVIGLGAVGSFAVEILARMGVGTLTLVDFDVVQESNINRQLYALHSTINLKKTELAKKRVLDINPDCKVNTLNVFVNTDTFEQIFSDVPDIVIDAIDSYNPKLRLLEYCYKNNIKIISSMGAALKTDPFSVKYADLFETHHCKLAERLRGDLRSLGISKGIPCVFSEQSPQVKPIPLPEQDGKKYGKNGGPKILGSTPVITGIFGILLANKAIELL